MQSFDFVSVITDVLQTGRDANENELADIRSHVAATGFEATGTTRVGQRVIGLRWQGHVLAGRERLTVEIAHYLRHVVAAHEWPPRTTVVDYVDSLRTTILNPTGPVLIDTIPGWPRLTFFGRSGSSRGPGGGDWILVAFDVNYGYWTTGYQPDLDPETHRHHATGGASRWLYRPEI
jgi:hypothetical protein